MNKEDYEIILDALQYMKREDDKTKNLIERVKLYIDKYTIDEKYKNDCEALGKRFDDIVKGEANGKEK